MDKKTILFLAANPSNTTQLDLKQEVEQVEKELQRLQSREQFVFKQQWATTLEALRHALLDHKPNIIHFSGHGAGQSGIVLEDDAGKRQDVDGETLANFLEPFNIDCVILNACFTALQASAIVQHVDFVIGMNQPIQNGAAIQFAVGFYDALAAGELIPDAFDLGRANITSKDERLKPVLKQRFVNSHWLVPIAENSLFTGRLEILHELQETLHFRNVAALSGLGGMGKTQTAAHYARLHRYEYRAILWCLADTKTELNLGLEAIGRELGLPVVKEQEAMVAAVLDWLAKHDHWLLILDNADEIKLVGELAELAGKDRHVLVTTRTQITEPFAQAVKVNEMSQDDGVNFLLRKALDRPRSKSGTIGDYSFADRNTAEELVELLGALPLALDQAGAYVRETLCGLAGYLKLYRKHGYELLRERGVVVNESDHPDPIAVTWLLSLEKVEQANPKAIELLNLCAFLHPDGIPEEVFGDWDDLEFEQALKVVLQFSFVWRDAGMLRIHRLVQGILRHELGEEQKDWAEKAVLAMNRIFPYDMEVSDWPTCERLLPCALTCAELIEEWKLESEEAGILLNQIAYYLDDSKADYKSAKSLYERSLAIKEKVYGEEHSEVATGLNNLALLYKTQGNYKEAKPLYERSLAISEKVHEKEHPDVATSLNNLALLYRIQGDYKTAKLLYERSLAIREKVYGKEHPDIAQSINNLAVLYYSQGDYKAAKPLYERALDIWEKVHGEEHPLLATSLNNLATLYKDQSDCQAAKPLYERALAIDEKIYGKEHPDVARDLNNQASLYDDQGDYEQAKPLYERSLAIDEKVYGKEHPDVAIDLNNLASLYKTQGDYEKAKPLYERAIKIANKFFEPDHPDVRLYSENYAGLLEEMKNPKPKKWWRRWLGL
ncbi:FxSxx-COOH system tetratricopeptide repeat protein [Thiotrichales bacterium HSG1]|nr:FxSxx-COOH system tetratricopeptide repeat protein [Thiotrichales bacterium HSG1]